MSYFHPIYQRIIFAVLSTLLVVPCFATVGDSISFKYTGHINFPSLINHTIPCNLIFDTGGADIFGVDSVFLAQSGWKPAKLVTAMAKGAAGYEKVKVIADGTNVKLGYLESTYEIVPVFHLRDIVDGHVDGLIGIRDIETNPFEINFEHSYMCRHRSLPVDVSTYMCVPIIYQNNKVLLNATVKIGDVMVKGLYQMDTGDGGTIDFTAETAEKFHFDSMQRKKVITDISNFGIGSKKVETVVDMQCDHIVIGEDTIENRSISYMPEGVGAFGKRDWVGVIGNGIWSKYNIVLDIRHQRIYIRRFKKDIRNPMVYDYGFRNRTDICDGWIVSSLERGGDAAKAGMELGDTVVTVNGKLAKDLTWDEEEAVGESPVQALTLRGVSGNMKHIELKAKQRW